MNLEKKVLAFKLDGLSERALDGGLMSDMTIEEISEGTGDEVPTEDKKPKRRIVHSRTRQSGCLQTVRRGTICLLLVMTSDISKNEIVCC